MTGTDDIELLREFAENNSEAAFAALAGRHVNLVYSVALRHTGNPHAAEEITQAVFIILARKAKSFSRQTVLTGWLHQTTRLTAANFLRTEIRRQHRESEAFMQSALTETETWTQIAPLLDDAISKLGERDRNAILLRYFENKSAREMAAALRMDEPAAQKRVTRAVEKLRAFFAKRGVTLTATAAKGAAVSGSTLTLIKGALKIMAWTKMKTIIVAGAGMLLAAGTTTFLVEKHLQAKQYIIAREPWSDVGAATPKAALESLAWALTHDKFDRAQELMQWDEKGLTFAGDAKMQQQFTLMGVLAPALKDIESFRILSIMPTKQSDELIVKIEKTFKNKNIRPFAVTVKLRRVGNQWRAAGNLEYFESGSRSMLLPFTGSF